LLGRYMMLYSYFSERAASSFHIYEGFLLCFFVIFSAFVIGYVAYAGKEK
jgi:hypothetical protein